MVETIPRIPRIPRIGGRRDLIITLETALTLHAQVGLNGSLNFSGASQAGSEAANGTWSTNGANLVSSAAGAHTMSDPQIEVWVHWRVHNDNVTVADTAADNAIMTLRDNAGGRDLLRLKCLNGTMTIEAWNGAAWVQLGSASMPFPYQGVFNYDVRFFLDDTLGSVEVYANEALAMSFSGDTILNASTTADRVTIMTPVTDTGGINFTDVIITNGCTIGAKMVQPLLAANGADTGWTGLRTGIDETGNYDDVDFITVGTSGTSTSYTVADMPAIFDVNDFYQLAAVISIVRARYSGGAPTKVAHYLRDGGVNHYKPDITLTTSYLFYNELWLVNPTTLLPWTEAEFNALQVGVRSAV
jgi:hypothetical protein